jgi:16S rRNA (guanine527-N7)-methyltransferase
MSKVSDIQRGSDKLGVELSDSQAVKLLDLLALLSKWNQRVSLTATTDLDELIERHVLDSCAVLPHLSAEPLVDVGAGGGFPGLVLAICRPALDITMLEPIRKKHAFLSTARRELELDNVEPRAERDEQHEGRYGQAISRATWAVPEWLSRGRRLVMPGGRILAMEGRQQHELPAGAQRHPYELGDRERAIIVYEPSDS